MYNAQLDSALSGTAYSWNEKGKKLAKKFSHLHSEAIWIDSLGQKSGDTVAFKISKVLDA